MLKKFNSFMSLSILYVIMFAILGVIILMFPEESLTIVTYTTAITLIVFGIAIFIRFSDSLALFGFSLIGVFAAILGTATLIHPDIIKTIIPIVIGLWIIINSVFKIKLSLILKKHNENNWYITVMLSCLAILCGSIMIINPEFGLKSLTMTFGILLLVYSIADFINLIIFKRKINVLVKDIKE